MARDQLSLAHNAKVTTEIPACLTIPTVPHAVSHYQMLLI